MNLNLTNRDRDMVLDGQKVWTDGIDALMQSKLYPSGDNNTISMGLPIQYLHGSFELSVQN